MKLKTKSKRLASLERNRYSVFTSDLDHCYLCGLPKEDLHEIMYGAKRINAMKFGFVLPLCRKCHNSFHKNHVLTEQWIRKCQMYFENSHTREEWLKKFKKNYL